MSIRVIDDVSRRQFLGGMFSTGAFVLAAQVVPRSAWAQDPMVKTRAQCLQPELRTRINHHVRTVVLDQQACAKTVVLWIRRSAHIALAPNHGHAVARSGPQERQTHCTCVLVIRQQST